MFLRLLHNTWFLLATFLVFLLNSSCHQQSKTKEEPLDFVSTKADISVKIEIPKISHIDSLAKKLTDERTVNLIKTNFDRFALFTIRNDSSKTLFLKELDNLIYDPSWSYWERKTDEFTGAIRDFSEPYGSFKLYSLQKGETKTFYLPYCKDCKNHGTNDSKPILADGFKFRVSYSFDSEDDLGSEKRILDVRLLIDSVGNAKIAGVLVKKYD